MKEIQQFGLGKKPEMGMRTQLGVWLEKQREFGIGFLMGLGLVVGIVGCGGRSGDATVSPPNPSPPGSPATVWDSLTSQALEASLTGQSRVLETLAVKAQIEEQSAIKEKQPHPTSSDQIQLLAALSKAPPLPTDQEAEKALQGFTLDESSRSTILTLRNIEPRSRLREARKVHRYDAIQTPLNNVSQACIGALQGQLFGFVELFVSGVESLWRYPYPSPTEREVIRARRDLNETPDLPGVDPELADEAMDGIEHRRRLAHLQALANARHEIDNNNLQRAQWWVDRARRLKPEDDESRKMAETLATQINQEAVNRQTSLSVVAGEDNLSDSNEKIMYAALIRAFIEAPASVETSRLREQFLARYPYSSAAGAVRLTEFPALYQQDRADSARTLCEWLARTYPDLWAGAKARVWARDPRFSARTDFKQARTQERAEWWNFLIFNERPNHSGVHVAGEDARLEHGAWLRYLRPIFITDILNRLIALPFGWPLDHSPTLDAIGRWTPPPSGDAEAPERAVWRADALYSDKRYGEAERAYSELNPPDWKSSRQSAEKAAEQRLDRAQKLSQPELRARALRRLINAYPETSAADKARNDLEDVERRRTLILAVSKEELLNRPKLWAPDALAIPPELLDKRPGNGEISREGVELHDGNRVVYEDEEGGPRRELRPAPEGFLNALQQLGPIRRKEKLAEEEARPGRILHIPLQVEGNAFPGFEGAPGLTPLRDQPTDILYR